jgi:aspartate/methionine/tyrosine aminotransferase
LSRERVYDFTPSELRREVLGRGLSALLLSNPCNPMGKLISGRELRSWVEVARDLDCTLLLDEFYSHYIWNADAQEPDHMVSAARYVEDVDRDPVVILDGLTKNWRYPGWRVTWTVGPKRVIEGVASAGSYLDGGGSKPLQRAAIDLLSPDEARAETEAIRRAFLPKRELMMHRTRELGMRLDRTPDGTFYLFVSLADLPPPLNDGMSFFRAALKRRVITVPGIFFDVNPGGRRAQRLSRFRQYSRLSFGPSQEEVSRGLDRLKEMLDEAQNST